MCDEMRPDVVLLDVMLGAESGFDVAEQGCTAALAPAAGDPALDLLEQDLVEVIGGGQPGAGLRRLTQAVRWTPRSASCYGQLPRP